MEIRAKAIHIAGKALVQGVWRDITDRTRAEEARQLLVRGMIQAQDEERRRIARDLHTDFRTVQRICEQLPHRVMGKRRLKHYNTSDVRVLVESNKSTRTASKKKSGAALPLTWASPTWIWRPTSGWASSTCRATSGS